MIRVSRIVFQFWLALAVVGHCSIAFCQDDDPFLERPDADSSEWGSGDADETDGWKAGVATINERSAITSGGVGCPVILGGSAVFSTDFDSESSKQIGKLNCEIGSRTLTALASDGTHVAVAKKSKANKDVMLVSVYDLKTGKKTSEIPGKVGERVETLLITRGKYVAIAGHGSDTIRVWNGVTGKLVKEFEMPKGTRLDQGNVAFTRDGKYMAVVQRKKLVVIKVATEKVVATMEPPRMVDRDGNPTGRSTSSPSSLYAWIQDLEFSPDGTELAAVTTHGGTRLFCWNKNAKLVVNQPFSTTQRNAFWENDLQWMPDGKSWLVAGNLIDRENGRVLLAFEKKFGKDTRMVAHDQNTMLGRLGSAPNTISKVEIPWAKIDRARQAIADKEPAIIAPHQSVDIRLEFGKTLGAAADAKKSIVEAVQNRLKRDGINYEAGAPNYFKLRLSESAGDTLPIYERQSAFDRRGHDTGRTIAETKGSLVVEFYAEGNDAPVWREVLDAKSSRSFREEINSRTVRESMLNRLSSDLGRMQIPYFMPVDKSLPSLPMIFE